MSGPLPAPRALPRGLRLALTLLGGLAVVLAVFTRAPIVQGPEQYRLADGRALLGLPNAWNVLTNLPFLAAGWLGWRRRQWIPEALRPLALLTFASIAAVSVGSSLYHLAPGPDRLLVDRLPITVGFLALFAWVLGDRLGARVGRILLAPLLGLGLASLLAWHGGGGGEGASGGGDLRYYVLVQAVPLVVIPLLLAFFPGAIAPARLGLALGLYGLAKGFEFRDEELFAWLGVSGHSLKHLAAAAACLWLPPARASAGEPRTSAPR